MQSGEVMLNKIVLEREGNCIYTRCSFCDGYVPIDFEPLHNEGMVRIKGKCKKCTSYIQIRTQRYNVVTNWVP